MMHDLIFRGWAILTSPRATSRPDSSRAAKCAGSRIPPRRQRGIALLLVMIGMIVCSILTAGFLSTQGTSIGIARNERDAGKCRGLAQAGIDMCYWLIRNKSDWRETISPGTWLNSFALGDGTVTVTAADGAGSNNFANDPTQAVVLTSTGTYDNRTFTLTASIRPTGGGTVFNDGNYILGNILVGNGDLLTASTIDSYNSSVASYNPALPGSNALFGSGSLANNALTVYFPSVFRGSYLAAPTAVIGNVLGLVGLGASGPSSTSVSTETRNPGTVIMPNTTGLAYNGTIMRNTATGNYSYGAPGRYDNLSIGVNSTVNLTGSGIYYIPGAVNVSSGLLNVLSIADGKSVVLVVDGNFTFAGKLSMGPTSRLAIYCNGNISITGAVNTSGDTSHLTVFGSSSCGQITLSGTGSLTGAVFAPQASFSMPSGSPKFYGAVVSKDLTIKGTGAVHFDEALRTLKISNISGGSAPSGNADYRLTIIGGPGITHSN